MKRPLSFQNGFLASEWLSGNFPVGYWKEREGRRLPPCLPRRECKVLGTVTTEPSVSQTPASLFRAQSMFMMKLYIWVSTTKWTGRQERRSWVAGSHVSQERALYCSRTNLRDGKHIKRLFRLCWMWPFFPQSSELLTWARQMCD